MLVTGTASGAHPVGAEVRRALRHHHRLAAGGQAVVAHVVHLGVGHEELVVERRRVVQLQGAVCQASRTY